MQGLELEALPWACFQGECWGEDSAAVAAALVASTWPGIPPQVYGPPAYGTQRRMIRVKIVS